MEQVTTNDGIKGKIIPVDDLKPYPDEVAYEHLTKIIHSSSTIPDRYILAVSNGKIRAIQLISQDACVLPISDLAYLVADRVLVDDKTAKDIMAALTKRFS